MNKKLTTFEILWYFQLFFKYKRFPTEKQCYLDSTNPFAENNQTTLHFKRGKVKIRTITRISSIFEKLNASWKPLAFNWW